MAEADHVKTSMLVEVTEGEEVRSVQLIAGDSLVVLEQSRGPVTEVAYGAPSHGHKMVFARDACARVLGVDARVVERELGAWFATAADPLLLSDLMDCFDRAGERYGYASWTSGGDVAFRP